MLGTDVIEIQDNNKQMDQEPSIFGNNLWALYIMQALGTFGLAVVVKNT